MRFLTVCLLAVSVFVPAAASEPHAPAAPERKLGPRDVLWRLRQGNQAFVAGRLTTTKAAPARRASLVAGQHPHAVVLTCADSRVPPEHIFNEGLGHLFVVRVAGVVADRVVVGSVEYAVEHLHSPLVVVMGHTRCGAVKAAMDSKPGADAHRAGPNLEDILARLRPGLGKAHPHADPWTTAVFGGVEQTVEDLLKLSQVIPKSEAGLVGAVYELESGKVSFSDLVHFKDADAAGRFVRWSGARHVAARHEH